MLKTLVTLAVAGSFGVAASLAGVNQAGAQPIPEPPAPGVASAPDVDNGAMPSAPPGILPTPEGWILSVKAVDESQLAVAPLTTAVSSREYLVGGTFLGEIAGSGTAALAGGTLEAGYQIGCGISADVVDARFGGNITPSLSSVGVPSVGGGLFAQIRPTPQAGHRVRHPGDKDSI